MFKLNIDGQKGRKYSTEHKTDHHKKYLEGGKKKEWRVLSPFEKASH